jgi:hypothetical protein
MHANEVRDWSDRVVVGSAFGEVGPLGYRKQRSKRQLVERGRVEASWLLIGKKKKARCDNSQQ